MGFKCTFGLNAREFDSNTFKTKQSTGFQENSKCRMRLNKVVPMYFVVCISTNTEYMQKRVKNVMFWMALTFSR